MQSTTGTVGLMRAFALAAIPIRGGCVPPMANMQSARTLESGESRIAGYASTIKEKQPDGSADVAKAMGVLIGGGGDHSELQLRFDRFQDPDGDGSNTFLSLGPKISAVDDSSS